MGVCAVNDCDGPCLPNSEYCFMHRKLNKDVEGVKKNQAVEDTGAVKKYSSLTSWKSLNSFDIFVLVILFLLAAITIGPSLFIMFICMFSGPGICF